jgi:predicted nucleic acid-binding protein
MNIEALLDTSMLVDLLCVQVDALRWWQTQAETVFGIPVLVHMELINGAANAVERRHLKNLLLAYPAIHLTPEDSAWAQQQHALRKLSPDAGLIAALIAAPARRLGVPIYTLTPEHFSSLSDVEAIRPY